MAEVRKNLIEDAITYEKIVEQYGKNTVDKVIAMIAMAEGKRRQLPPAIRVSKKAFGIERRIPMDHTFKQI